MTKLEFTIKYVYEVDDETAQKLYETTDSQEILAIDLGNFLDQPFTLVDELYDADLEITGKVID